MKPYPALRTLTFILKVMAAITFLWTCFLGYKSEEIASQYGIQYIWVVLIILFFAGAVVVLFYFALGETIDVFLDLDKTNNQQVELNKQTNILLAAILTRTPLDTASASINISKESGDKDLASVTASTSINDEAGGKDIASVADSEPINLLSPYNKIMIKLLMLEMKDQDVIVLNEDNLEVMSHKKYLELQLSGQAEKYTLVLKKQ